HRHVPVRRNRHGCHPAFPRILQCSQHVWRRPARRRSEEHTSELQSLAYLVCRLLLEKKKHPRLAQADVVHLIATFSITRHHPLVRQESPPAPSLAIGVPAPAAKQHVSTQAVLLALKA